MVAREGRNATPRRHHGVMVSPLTFCGVTICIALEVNCNCRQLAQQNTRNCHQQKPPCKLATNTGRVKQQLLACINHRQS